MKKFTFKTDKPTGKYRYFQNSFHNIKLNKILVGSIDDSFPYRIRLKVLKPSINEDNNPNCSWKWISLKADFDSLIAAKSFVLVNGDQIQKQFNLVTE